MAGRRGVDHDHFLGPIGDQLGQAIDGEQLVGARRRDLDQLLHRLAVVGDGEVAAGRQRGDGALDLLAERVAEAPPLLARVDCLHGQIRRRGLVREDVAQ